MINLTEKIRLTVSLGIRCLFATCSIGVVKSSFDANLNRLLPVGYSGVSSQPESNLNTEKNNIHKQTNKSNLTVLVYSLTLNLREIENISDMSCCCCFFFLIIFF